MLKNRTESCRKGGIFIPHYIPLGMHYTLLPGRSKFHTSYYFHNLKIKSATLEGVIQMI